MNRAAKRTELTDALMDAKIAVDRAVTVAGEFAIAWQQIEEYARFLGLTRDTTREMQRREMEGR
jgi:hypothetical protein